MIFLFFYLEISSRLNGETGRDLDDPATHVTPNPWQGQQLSAASRQFGKIQLTVEEYGDIRSQFCDRIERQRSTQSPSVMSSRKPRGRTYLPYAFTEQGVALPDWHSWLRGHKMCPHPVRKSI